MNITDINKLMKNSSAYFKSPLDVCKSESITKDQKIEILRHWEYDTRELEVAEEENMGGGPPGMLHEILEALGKLGAEQNFKHPSPTKQH